ncbi:ATP-binding protein [Spirochaeta lutea]|uniref:ATP/GTP-binding protein n=1 Tax=Spirochaeta lutea TaxID=1480694 RepID=A0A098QZ78_9SPIO|nr:ATP-binding protein [Spirochaeta lutea]KGE73220.1 ATP/GTP-binding protein [Spirochaeta lutea]
MKIKEVRISNFRNYKDDTTIDFNDLTVFVGRNDIGKSTVLEALDIFFNEKNGIIKIDPEDINKENKSQGNNNIEISVIFQDLPDSITIDASNPTTLAEEYLLNNDGYLEIKKRFPNAGKEKVFIIASHPTNPDCSELLLKKNSDLKKALGSIPCEDKTKNASIRKAIWNHYSTDLQLDNIEIDVTKEDAKNIWEQLKNYMPLYALFQSDRKNSDGDSEIQDPLKEAVRQILNNEELKNKFNEISTVVEMKLREVSTRTLEKLREMNPEVADSLNPVIPPAENLKWADVFKNVSISGDEDIPINKRGSGIKRLVLLNFFRAEAERRQAEKNVPNIIYAIEEPETSQHPAHQRKLIEAFITLSEAPNTQVILTTHSPAIVKLLKFEHLKLIKQDDRKVIIQKIERSNLPYPSLNEVNFLAFGESDDEYHNELYGFIESESKLQDFKQGKSTVEYIKLKNDGSTQNIRVIFSEYIRHQIHHPENTRNTRFTNDQLQESIGLMRDFVRSFS